jgi:purine-nucleoside phosphorylase
MKLSARIQEASLYVQERMQASCAHAAAPSPRSVVILGSGLGFVADALKVNAEIPYRDIPGCNAASAPGHKGSFIVASWNNAPLICLNGRLHGYEGNSPLETVMPLLVAHALGARRLITTNAAGAINADFEVGSLMLITDHINFTGASPLTLDADCDLPNLNFDMSYAYTPALCTTAHNAALECGITLHEGVYLGLGGPLFETPAEIRAFRSWGADAVGMSTVHEVIMATALKMEVCGISLISNMAAGILDEALTTGEVIEVAKACGSPLAHLVKALLV